MFTDLLAIAMQPPALIVAMNCHLFQRKPLHLTAARVSRQRRLSTQHSPQNVIAGLSVEVRKRTRLSRRHTDTSNPKLHLIVAENQLSREEILHATRLQTAAVEAIRMKRIHCKMNRDLRHTCEYCTATSLQKKSIKRCLIVTRIVKRRIQCQVQVFAFFDSFRAAFVPPKAFLSLLFSKFLRINFTLFFADCL